MKQTLPAGVAGRHHRCLMRRARAAPALGPLRHALEPKQAQATGRSGDPASGVGGLLLRTWILRLRSASDTRWRPGGMTKVAGEGCLGVSICNSQPAVHFVESSLPGRRASYCKALSGQTAVPSSTPGYTHTQQARWAEAHSQPEAPCQCLCTLWRRLPLSIRRGTVIEIRLAQRAIRPAPVAQGRPPHCKIAEGFQPRPICSVYFRDLLVPSSWSTYTLRGTGPRPARLRSLCRRTIGHSHQYES